MRSVTRLGAKGAARPEAMADVPGVCELPLTRAVVQYRDRHQLGPSGGRIEDVGLALVLEGRYASSAEAIDLGSADVKRLDLSTELVVLDWVYPPTLQHVTRLLGARSTGDERRPGEALEPYCFDLVRQVLGRVGFGPLTRPTLLRIGFRDVCRDLDLHEGTSVRFVRDGGRIVRAHLDYDACALNFRTSGLEPDPELERMLADAFPGRDVRRLEPGDDAAAISYQVRFPLPLSLAETRRAVDAVRRGLAHLLARFEPRRYRATEDVLDVLGTRRTLAGLHLEDPGPRSVRLGESGSGSASRSTVH